jgi:uncharacterized protein (TIGR00645 family)
VIIGAPPPGRAPTESLPAMTRPEADPLMPEPAPPSVGPLTRRRQFEGGFEQILFGSRWLMAPMYFGLVLSLGLVAFIFLRELIESVPHMLTESADDAILVVLSLIDLTLAGNLLLIVLFSGYENFVSKLNIDDGGDRPDWMGKVDFAGLKMKLVGSIVAISAIHLLKEFMELGKEGETVSMTDGHLFWLTVIHLTFVTSGLLLAVMDYLGARSGGKH